MARRGKRDDELLCLVFSHISPLSSRFALAAVNSKFRRCMVSQIRKPTPLEVDFSCQTLNGCAIAVDSWPNALKVLVQKTQFDQILMDDGGDVLEVILNIFLETDQCLNALRSLMIPNGETRDLVLNFIAKCPKLSVLHLGHVPNMSLPCLQSALDNKNLRELSVCLMDTTQTEVLSLFQSLKPHILEKLELQLEKENLPEVEVDLAELVRQLSCSAWAALKHLEIITSHDLTIDFFAWLPRLPVLADFTIYKCGDLISLELAFACVGTLFKHSTGRPSKLTVDFQMVFDDDPFPCAIMNAVRQVQAYHTRMQLNFEITCPTTRSKWFETSTIMPHYLILTLDNITLTIGGSCDGICEVENCVDCHSYYPVVMKAIVDEAQKGRSIHMEAYYLDKCKVNRFVEDCGRALDGVPRVLFAHVDAAQSLAAIIFESDIGQYVTVYSRTCINSYCFECLSID